MLLILAVLATLVANTFPLLNNGKIYRYICFVFKCITASGLLMYNVHNVDGLCYSVYICGFILCTERGNKFAKRQRK